jgi:hypothetical protein
MTTAFVIHIALVLLSVPFTGEPEDFTFSLVRFVNFMIIQPTLAILLVTSYVLQASLTSKRHDPGTLSKQTLALQGAVFLALAIAWPFRLILPTNMWTLPRFRPAVINAWYPIVGWACVNSALSAVGSAYVLYYSSQAASETVRAGEGSERRPLLAS